MTGEELLKQLEEIRDGENPEQLKLDVVHVYTEYNSPEDSIGCEIERDLDDIRVSCRSPYGRAPKRDVLVIGY